VPLDPSHPADRLAYIAADAGITTLVASRSAQAEPLTEVLRDAGVAVIDIDVARDAGAGPESRESVRPENLAYLMYTSGSTGRPKGVCSTHVGVANLLQGMDRITPLGPDDRCSWWTSGGFDVSVYEIFSALHAGAALLVVPEEVRPHPERLADWLADNAITGAYVPPFALTALAERAEAATASPVVLRRLIVGVEPLPEPLLRRIMAAIPGVHVVNAYGPTETTVFSTVHDLDPHSTSDGITPLGQPVQNGPIYLLDEQDRPVPVGVPGELYIGGVGLARGYHRNPARTAEAFRPDPFGWTPGGRMYATGDIARYRPDALLQFLGRRDNQVKIRGVRVELGEIEAVLAGHPSVRSALVMIRPINGVPALVGYVESNGTANEPELLAHLRRALPGPMVPAAVLTVPAWPTTVNGKLDRRALPDPDDRDIAAYEEPQGDLECAVADAWSQLFGGRRIGRRDDFFALGGHSLLAARTALLLGARLGVEVPVSLMFTHPTPADLAGELDRLVADRAGGTPITALPRAGQGVEDLIARIEDLPPDVVAALLQQYGPDTGSHP
jgi:amino acid adenylation domain-containing protein